MGAIEVALAMVVLLVPRPGLLAGVALWKIGTEMLYPMAGAPIWEWIERGGSFAAPLLLAILATRRAVSARTVPRAVGLTPATVVIALLVIAPTPMPAQEKDIPVAPAGVLDSLKRGGYVITCRHAATDHTQSDRGATRDLQRNLSPAGEDDAKAIGAAIRVLRIPIGDVRANYMYRNQETAEYAFGKMVVDSSLVRGSSLRALLVAPVPDGTNRAIVVRQGTLGDAMGSHGLRNPAEGECFVVRRLGDDTFRILGRLRVEHWSRNR
jgi:hypothetical protein